MGPERLAARKARLASRERFLKARKAETAYARNLKAVARQIGSLIRGFTTPQGVVTNLPSLQASLEQYAATLRPWSKAVTQKMHSEVGTRNAKAWEELANEMGFSLRRQLGRDPIGEYMREALNYQVDLITSLPLEAAERVHRLTMRGISAGSRGQEIRDMILNSTHVTVSRAVEIARTETARTSALLTEGRAKSIGSEEYIWRTAQDSDVRHRHQLLEGKTFRWDRPPVTGEDGERSHPGCIYNCRCYAEPILPDALFGIGIAA